VTGAKIAGAVVSYSGGSTTTDSGGAYSLPGVTEGSYAVSVSAAGYDGQSPQVSVGPGANVVKNVALAPLPGTVSGTVVDIATGTPLAGATVTLLGWQYEH